jgi:aminoglycoside phosphotransferase (APT) family kinase protein
MPRWWTDRDVWLRALEIFHRPAPDEPPVFIHRDFHPGNVLWTGARPSAIVDWLHGCLGPASVDIAHCRLNLWLDIGPQAADGLLDAYRAIGVELPTHNPYWDIADAMSWRIDPVRDGFTRARRYESFVVTAVTALRE